MNSKHLTLAFSAWLLFAGAAVAMAQTGRSLPEAPFMLRPGDMVRVQIWPDSTLNGEFIVEEGGVVSFPAVGAVNTSNLSYVDLREELRRRYGLIMKSPLVTVVPLVRVSVMGAVERPGLYQVNPTHTLIDLIALTGGFAEDANEKTVNVARGDQVYIVNTSPPPQGNGGIVPLRSGDRIIVPRRSRFGWGTVTTILQASTFAVTLYTLLSQE